MTISNPNPAVAGRIVGWIIAVILTLCAFGFYYAHQVRATGFFTAGFTAELAVLLYVSILYLIVNATAKLLTDRKGSLAMVELLGALLTGFATLCLFVVFPFNFAHVGDVLPSLLQPLLRWVTNDIGRILYAVAVFGSVIAIIVDSAKLLTARN
ncbi:MAG TPA: hypothetical protein VF478_00490 [Anaerolineae bacterium]